MDAPRLPDARPLLVLAEVASAFERDLVRTWAAEQGLPTSSVIEIPSARSRRRREISPILDARLNRAPDATVVPVRVAWLAEERDGRRRVRLVDIVKAVGDPRDPAPWTQQIRSMRHPDSFRLLVAEPARAGDLVRDWHDSYAPSRLGEYVARRAWLALERAERKLRGNRYKVARFVAEEITAQGEFQAGLVEIAEETGQRDWYVQARAKRLLAEIAATPTTLAIDLIAGLIHLLYRQGYRGIEYDRHHLLEIYSKAHKTSLVFLPSHKSQLDRLVMQYVLWENDLPPSHTAGGININFWPVGPLVRRSGVFFIRRSFKEDATYKFVLRSYLDYLLSRRFPIEWYLEGGRSRTGKLRPPSLGLLHYVVDSYERGVTDDILLIPTSITYDQIQDIGDYSAEAQGADKRDESFGWFVGAVASLRRRYGDVHIRFGQPLSLRKDWAGDAGEGSVDIAKLAFEVMMRINAATPISPTGVVSLHLTDEPGPATAEELAERIAPLAAAVERRNLPRTARFDRPIDVEVVLDRMAEHGFVERDGERWVVTDGSLHPLAFYRNVSIHHFLVPAIADLAHRLGGDVEDTALAIRRLFQFEFFFEPSEAFLASLDDAHAMAEEIGDLPRLVLEPFLESYYAVVDLAANREELPDTKEAMAHVQRLLEHGRLRRQEAAALPILSSALKMLGHAGIEGDEEALHALREQVGTWLEVATKPAPVGG